MGLESTARKGQKRPRNTREEQGLTSARWQGESAREMERRMRREAREGGNVIDLEERRLRREMDSRRPKKRSECGRVQVIGEDGRRKCMNLLCRFNLFLDVNPETGAVKLNFPDKNPWELEETCALDVAERDGCKQETVGLLLNRTREAMRQIEINAAKAVRENRKLTAELGDFVPLGEIIDNEVFDREA